MTVRVQTEDFDLSTEVAALRAQNPKVGAVACFVGTTEKSLEAIVDAARERWPGTEVLIVHRVGKLMPLDQIVLVTTTSKHRGNAFASCEFVMDYLKTQAPFWKKEKTESGEHWVDARVADDEALARWGLKSLNSR
jgi:molybdopterin synthase catalytic subunit